LRVTGFVIEASFAAPSSSGLVAADDASMCVEVFASAAFADVRSGAALLHRVPQLRLAAFSTLWTTREVVAEACGIRARSRAKPRFGGGCSCANGDGGGGSWRILGAVSGGRVAAERVTECSGRSRIRGSDAARIPGC